MPVSMLGLVLPQIPFMVAGKLVNLPANPLIGEGAGQAVSLPANPLVDEGAGRPVRRGKRSRVAIEVEDEPIIPQVSSRKRQKRTG
jgi:hypothetical protein